MKVKFEKLQTYVTMFLLVVQFTRLLSSVLERRKEEKLAKLDKRAKRA